MRASKKLAILPVCLLGLLILLAGCGPGATAPGNDPATLAHIADATEIVQFNPASIPLGNSQPVGGECRASTVVIGTLRCELATGEASEPCFATGGGSVLCDPNPVTGSYAHLINPTSALPSMSTPPFDRAVQFFVELDGGMTCALRTGPEPVIINGATALYDCDQPYTFLMGIDRSAPTWTVTLDTLNPSSGETSTVAPAAIKRVWIP